MNAMEQRQLRRFVAVADELHFTRAAARLGIPQPALSLQIRQFEAELGVVLFRRSKRRVELTAAGQVLLAEARRALAQLDWAVGAARRAEQGEVGRLALGFVGPATYSVLPPVLRAFHERFPDVELDVDEMNTGRQLPALREGRLHVGFLRPPTPDESDGLVVEPVLREAVVVALRRGHPLAGDRRVRLRDLADEPLLIFRRDLEPTLYDSYMRLCADAGITPRVLHAANPMHLIIGLVAADLGFALLPASVRNLQRPDVVYRPLEPQPPRVVVAAAWRPDEPSPVLRAFLSVMREVVGHQTPAASPAAPGDDVVPPAMGLDDGRDFPRRLTPHR
jgi:DNA-binding transcriptional LysR family regulator